MVINIFLSAIYNEELPNLSYIQGVDPGAVGKACVRVLGFVLRSGIQVSRKQIFLSRSHAKI